jgi:hypothetical protein
MKAVRKRISNWIGWPWNVIKLWHISMESLMHSKEMEEIGWGGVGGSNIPAFPKGSVETVTFGHYGLFTDIKTLTESIEVEKPLANSRSKFVMEPCGFSANTSQEEMKSGQRCHHTRGCMAVKPNRGASCGQGN